MQTAHTADGANPSGGAHAADGDAPSLYLLVVEHDSSFSVRLPDEGRIVIGRAPESDVRVRDDRVSRRHLALTVAADHVRLADLGSRHGTAVNGKPIAAPRPLISGDEIAIGRTTLVFHRSAPSRGSRRLLDDALFRQRVVEELDRARRYGRALALVIASFASARPDRARIAAALDGRLRLVDTPGFTGDAEMAFLLPELTDGELGCAASELRAALGRLDPELKLGLARCPDDGFDADTLVSTARAAAASAPPGDYGTPADVVRVERFGEHELTLADPAMLRVYDLIRRLAPSQLAVLISGETGTGKELAAAALHHQSARCRGPFRAVNCAALPEHLVESELFGHARGAFSGAIADKPGIFASAEGGTVFLDELGELSLGVQAKLLRALESQAVRRVGDVREQRIDVRIVAATNRDLVAEAEAGRFRTDLLFRLGAARIVLPPLRDRRRELALLARGLLARALVGAGRDRLPLSRTALQAIHDYAWPGNVRELKNAMDYAAATAPAQATMIGIEHLPDDIARSAARSTGSSGALELPAAHGDPAATFDGHGLEPPPASAPPRGDPLEDAAPVAFRPIGDEVRELERTRMVQALRASHGQRNRAAALIAMPLRTFVTKLKRYAIDDTEWTTAGGDATPPVD